MNFSDQIVLVFLEEDNVQRAFFRVRPLLCEQGALTAQQIAEFPDDGFLRIVPDKNEQHTFKERMRSLSGLCILNLKDVPPEANKIRTNKNYSQARGETNQFIVYSDAVQPIPQNEFYEVVAQNAIQSAATPQVYTRLGGNIHGPVDKATGEDLENAQQLPPDSPGLFAVTLPNGTEKLFYWPTRQPKADVRQEPAKEDHASPAAEKPMTALEQIQKMDEDLNASVNRLDAPSVSFAPTPASRPMTGTPLYQSSVRRSSVQRSHNPLMETVETQRRYEAPGAQLSGDAETRDVVNPVEQFKRALAAVWRTPETQRQTVEAFLMMPGTRDWVVKTVSTNGSDLTMAAMQSQLQDLEAERLMALMQLDNLKKDSSLLMEAALRNAEDSAQRQLHALENEKKNIENAISQLSAERDQLMDDRDRVLDEIEAMADADDVIRLAPQKGEKADVRIVLSRLIACLKAQGFEGQQEDAAALLINFALSDGLMGVLSRTVSDALDASRALVHALGAASAVDVSSDSPVHVYSGGDTPAFILSPKGDGIKEDAPYTTVLLNVNPDWADQPGKPASHMTCGYSYVPVGLAMPSKMPDCPPVQGAQLKSDILALQTPIPEDAHKLLLLIRGTLDKAGCPMPLRTFAMMSKFVAIAQNLMDGGVAAALDEAVMSFVVPFTQIRIPQLKVVCAAMPRVIRSLSQNA